MDGKGCLMRLRGLFAKNLMRRMSGFNFISRGDAMGEAEEIRKFWLAKAGDIDTRCSLMDMEMLIGGFGRWGLGCGLRCGGIKNYEYVRYLPPLPWVELREKQ